ncbi:MAG: polysaccharide biosynthesis/export family protein [Planctomycetes bacterium]|nr:polysaccharide biosynthesis/export family protein [Planctomycetota bacterium]
MQATRNGWLDPTVLGNFEESRTWEIRTSLTLEDAPSGIPGATLPVPADLVVEPIEPRISAGDSLAVEIFELRQPLVPYQAQVSVTATGYVNLPVVGRIYADGLTPEGLEQAIANTLRDRDILIDPEVTLNPVFIQRATYSIFGIGVSAANTAPLRAGTFPIRRPGLRILEAINQVGGLGEFVEDIYVFRYEDAQAARTEPGGTGRRGEATQSDSADAVALDGSGPRDAPRRGPVAPGLDATPLTPEEELIAVVVRPDEGLTTRQAAGIPPGTPGQGLTGPRTRKVEPASIDPTGKPARGPNDPYIWVGDEFVPNPAYQPSAEEATRPTTPADRTFAATVDWDRIAGDVSYQVLHIPAEMLRSGDPQVNIVIRPGDVIRIVSGEIGVYYVMGQVNRVGAFAFNAETITLKAAIATAGGLAGLAWPSRCTVYRRLGQREQMIQVDLDRIFAGKDADFVLKRGDIINVGTHPFAPFLQRLRALTLPNPVATVGYSFRYARSFNFTTVKNQFR